MKVAFTYDINDLHEVIERTSRRALRRPWDRPLAELWSILTLLPAMALYWYGPQRIGAFPILIATLGLVGAFAQWYTAQSRRTRVFDYLEYTCGGRGPFVCEIELGPDGVVTRQFGEEITRAWAAVVDVRDTAAGVELDLGRRGLVVVRSNGFVSRSDRNAFVRYAQEHCGVAGSGS